MSPRIPLFFLIGMAFAPTAIEATPLPACCAVTLPGKPVVNADQTVIILWDAGRQTQHFIRKASFKSEADDIGFIIPSPTQPELEESGNEAFPYLAKLTEPPIKRTLTPVGFGCGARTLHHDMPAPPEVTVLQQKEVAGFTAVVLEAKSAGALSDWLAQHGFALSKEVRAWAEPYVEQGWKFTALKVGKDRANQTKTVAAAALRISFKTDRPLFPYREPDPQSDAEALKAEDRLLRIYFIAEARYRGELTTLLAERD
jgi:hypothetical protein